MCDEQTRRSGYGDCSRRWLSPSPRLRGDQVLTRKYICPVPADGIKWGRLARFPAGATVIKTWNAANYVSLSRFGKSPERYDAYVFLAATNATSSTIVWADGTVMTT